MIDPKADEPLGQDGRALDPTEGELLLILWDVETKKVPLEYEPQPLRGVIYPCQPKRA